MKNNKGFVLIETIIVISILTIGLLSLYASYVLIMRKANNSNIPSPSNSYIAYQVGTKYIVNSNSHVSNKAYTEVYHRGDRYYIREVSKSGSPSTSSECNEELNSLFLNLNIEKVYYIDMNISDVFDSDLLLSFDGSSIDYLNSIKNNADINMIAEQTIIVKTLLNGKTEFSFYQPSSEADTVPLRSTVIGSNTANISHTSTTPGAEISSTSEKVLAATMDDYGLSYYYRGAVENNYLVFANMCWRIVRIVGNGAIKIVLYNADGPSCNETGDLKAFATINGLNYAKFNPSRNVMAYTGFMYGNDYPSATNITEIRQNNTDSTILTALKDWYDAKFDHNQRLLIADVIWCNDKSFYTTNPTSSYADYSGYRRIEIDKSPSLICPTIEGEELVSKYTSSYGIGNGELAQYKIGLLTADEVAFAGSMNQTNNTNYYLYENAKGVWWTMTPDIFRSSAYVYAVTSSGALRYQAVDSTSYIRPAIALDPAIEVLGNGTKTNPYMVIE